MNEEGAHSRQAESALVIADDKSLTTRKTLEQLRNDREIHKHSTIWTKDPHGGPYRKAIAEGYDPLKQNADGTIKKAALGYERVESGPTSNFVGNHMTQAAIDLVQAQLADKKDSSPGRKSIAAKSEVDESAQVLVPISGKQPDLAALRRIVRHELRR